MAKMRRDSLKPTVLNHPADLLENPWGSKNPFHDNKKVLQNVEGRRCAGCQRVALNEHLFLREGQYFCPDCKSK